MKKLILSLFSISFMITTTHAASMAWKSGALSFGGSDLKSNTSVTGYLVYLGNNGSLDDKYTVDKDFSASVVGELVSTDSNGTAKGSQLGETYAFTPTTSGPSSNGASFALLAKYVNGEDTWWNLSQTINTFAGLDLNDPTASPTAWNAFSFAGTNGTNPTLTAGGGWVKAIPEPATGALALAGIALLFRRRKA